MAEISIESCGSTTARSLVPEGLVELVSDALFATGCTGENRVKEKRCCDPSPSPEPRKRGAQRRFDAADVSDQGPGLVIGRFVDRSKFRPPPTPQQVEPEPEAEKEIIEIVN